MPALRPESRPEPAEPRFEPSAEPQLRHSAEDAFPPHDLPADGSVDRRHDRPARPLPPDAPGSGWRGILIGVMAFGLVVLVAIVIGVFELAGDDSAAPPAPIGSTPEGADPLDSDARTGAATPTEPAAASRQ